MVLETIEQDNYNCKYGDQKPTNKKFRRPPSDSLSSEEQIAYTHPARQRKRTEMGKKKIPNRNCHFCCTLNWSLEHICPARRAQCNNCKKTGQFAKVCKSKTFNRIQKESASDSHTKPWPEMIIFNPSTAALTGLISTKQYYWPRDSQKNSTLTPALQ